MDWYNDHKHAGPKWMRDAIIAFETNYKRPLTLTERVAICANSRKVVREHFQNETSETAKF
jgi:hypothetical protein